MYLLSLMIILAGLFIYAAHSKKWVIIFLSYTVVLYFILAAFEGFSQATPDNYPVKTTFWIINTIIFLLHIPIIIRISQADPKTHRVKKAREIFEKDVAHIHDDALHRHLEH